MTPLLDVRTLCRLPTSSKRRLNKKNFQLPRSQASKPTTDLGKIIGMSDSVLDMSASFFWNFINDIWTSDESIVVAIIGDLLRDSIEDKSLPWSSCFPRLLILVVLIFLP